MPAARGTPSSLPARRRCSSSPSSWRSAAPSSTSPRSSATSTRTTAPSSPSASSSAERSFVADRRLAHRALVQGGAAFADRPPLAEPDGLFSAGGRDINSSPYGPYWRLVRRNLAAEALHRARVSLFAPARARACDALVRAGGTAPVTLRPLLRRAVLGLLVYMCFGARLGREALDEIEELQRRVLQSYTSFPVFAFFPTITKRLFRGRWAAYVALARRQDEVFVPLIHGASRGGGDDPPCYADSLRALRVPDEGDRPLTDAEMSSLCSEFLNGGTDTTVTQSSTTAATSRRCRTSRPWCWRASGCTRRATEIGGYAVLKGAEVNFLVAEIGRDEAVWTAAREFRPERFLDGGEGCDVDITGSKEIKMMPFGAGRRMCPGYALGMRHAEYLVARMVRELEWLPAAEGEVVDMAETVDFTTVMKHPLRARIVPRN